MVEGLVWAIWLHLLQSTEQLTIAHWIDCLPGSCGVFTPQLGLSSELGYDFVSQSALAALIVIADMTCPMNVEFYYVSSQHITEILGFDRHPRMAALRRPGMGMSRGKFLQIMELRHLPPSTRAPGSIKADRCLTRTRGMCAVVSWRPYF